MVEGKVLDMLHPATGIPLPDEGGDAAPRWRPQATDKPGVASYVLSDPSGRRLAEVAPAGDAAGWIAYLPGVSPTAPARSLHEGSLESAMRWAERETRVTTGQC
jgi:hypothetical protein